MEKGSMPNGDFKDIQIAGWGAMKLMRVGYYERKMSFFN